MNVFLAMLTGLNTGTILLLAIFKCGHRWKRKVAHSGATVSTCQVCQRVRVSPPPDMGPR